jgi:hypothetical protein
VEPSPNAGQELVLVNALERSLFLFLVQAGASVRTLAAELHIGRPCSIGRDLRQSKITVNRAGARLEDAVCKEQFDIEVLGHNAVCPSANKAAGLLKQLLQVVGSLLSRSTVLVFAQMERAHLEIEKRSAHTEGSEIDRVSNLGQLRKVWQRCSQSLGDPG